LPASSRPSVQLPAPSATFNRATSDPLYIGDADFESSGQTMPNTVDIADFLTFNSNFNHSVPTPFPAN